MLRYAELSIIHVDQRTQLKDSENFWKFVSSFFTGSTIIASKMSASSNILLSLRDLLFMNDRYSI